MNHVKSTPGRSSRIATGLCSLLICAQATFAAGADGRPLIASPVLGTIQGSTLTIEGSNFGSPGPGSALVVRQGGLRFSIPSTAAVIASWDDSTIVINIDDHVRSGTVRVRTDSGISNLTRVDVFAYDWFDIPPTNGTNALPLSITVDQNEQFWINQEFHLDFQHLDPIAGAVTGIQIPKPPDPGPFASKIFGDHRTQTSEAGEDILVDTHGRVWFTQGGGYLYDGINPNHSRIVCYIPEAPPDERFRIYNMPGDDNEIIGLAWDEARGRMWVAQGSLSKHPVLASFDPEAIPFDNHFDFSHSLDDQICEQGGPYDDCYHAYPLPASSLQPAHMAIDNEGRVWYTAYWGNEVGVLDPDSGRVLTYPLPPAIGQSDPAQIVGSGPWQIVKSPFDGNIYFCEFFDSTIDRFDISRILDPACRSLNGQHRNPCIDQWVVPGADLKHQYVHSITFDAQGRLWYTQHGDADPPTDASLGYITPDWRHIVRLPSLGTFPANAASASDGVAVDPVTGDIYFCEFLRKRIGRLHEVP